MSRPEARTDLSRYYSRVAGHYARHWGPVLRPLGENLVRAMSLAPALSVLEVGVGTGDQTPMIEALAPGSRFVGIDHAFGMLRVARASRPDHDLCVMDGERLGLADGSFDAVLLAFVLFHLPDPVRALRDARRVARVGGAVGVSTWASDHLPGAKLWTAELDAIGAGPDELSTDVQRHELMDDETKLQGLLTAAGWESTRAWVERFERVWTVPELVETRQYCGGHARRLATLAPTARAACVRRVRERLEELSPDERVQEMHVVFAVGRKP